MAKSPITSTKAEDKEDAAEQQASAAPKESVEAKAKRIQSRAEAIATEFYRIKGSLCDYASLSHNERGFWHSLAAKVEK